MLLCQAETQSKKMISENHCEGLVRRPMRRILDAKKKKKKKQTEKQNEVQSMIFTFKVQNEHGAPMNAVKNLKELVFPTTENSDKGMRKKEEKNPL